MSNNNVFIGTLAENLALEYLQQQGLTLIDRNFETLDSVGKKTGEIDLIMKHQEFTVFVEVKARDTDDYGHVLEMVTRQKQAKIIRTAERYLLKINALNTTYSRFDIIGIELNKNQQITWIPNAFQVQ